MRPWILVGLGVFAILFVLGVLFTMIPKRRVAAEQEACKHNLAQLSQFAAHHAKPSQNARDKLRNEIPAGTIVLPDVPPESRLSWVVETLPGLDRRRQDIAAITEAIDV